MAWVAVALLSMTYWIAMHRVGTAADNVGDVGAVEAIRQKTPGSPPPALDFPGVFFGAMDGASNLRVRDA